MAFRRSPVRTRSGPPAFARPPGELRLGKPGELRTGEGCRAVAAQRRRRTFKSQLRLGKPREGCRAGAAKPGGGPVLSMNELRLGKPGELLTGEGWLGKPSARILPPFLMAESQKLRSSQGHGAHSVSFDTSAFGIAVASGLACRKTSDSSTSSRMPIRNHTSTSVERRTSPPASPTTTPAAAPTLRVTALGSFTSP
jgi:hypothetical protein